MLSRFAALRSPDWAHGSPAKWPAPRPWWTASCPRPPTPTTQPSRASLGLEDAWPVVTEPFTQWVVEDHFPAGRPDLAAAGVQMVADVTPFEHMKLRLLNASHSAMAYLGYLAGYETIAAHHGRRALRPLRARADGRGGLADAARCPPGSIWRPTKPTLIARFTQPGAAPPHLADRHGRLAEAAAAHPRHDPRPAGGRRADPAPCARGGGLDALCQRHGRARPGHRCARPDRG